MSKRKHVKQQGTRASLGFLVLLSGGMMVVCALVTLAYAKNLFEYLTDGSTSTALNGQFYASMIVLFAAGTTILWKWAAKARQERLTVDPGIPLTRVNAADLPASESLVRASSEPEQAQQAVLLRAAREGQESRAKNLIRASVGGRSDEAESAF